MEDKPKTPHFTDRNKNFLTLLKTFEITSFITPKKSSVLFRTELKESTDQAINYAIAWATATATSTEAPTMGLLPIPMSPIIST